MIESWQKSYFIFHLIEIFLDDESWFNTAERLFQISRRVDESMHPEREGGEGRETGKKHFSECWAKLENDDVDEGKKEADNTGREEAEEIVTHVGEGRVEVERPNRQRRSKI